MHHTLTHVDNVSPRPGLDARPINTCERAPFLNSDCWNTDAIRDRLASFRPSSRVCTFVGEKCAFPRAHCRGIKGVPDKVGGRSLAGNYGIRAGFDDNYSFAGLGTFSSRLVSIDRVGTLPFSRWFCLL